MVLMFKKVFLDIEQNFFRANMISYLRITHVDQLPLVAVSPRRGAQRADPAGGGEIRDGAGRAGAHRLAAALGERSERVLDLLHGLLVVARGPGWSVRIHTELTPRLLAHTGPYRTLVNHIAGWHRGYG